MFTSLTRLCLFLVAGALVTSAGTGQPPPTKSKEFSLPKNKWSRDYYTAFPDLKPVTLERKEVKKPNGDIDIVIEEKGAVALPALPELGANAPTLRRIKFEQLCAGLSYIEYVRGVIRIGNWTAAYFREYMEVVTDVYRIAAELEENPAKRVLWYEARVRTLKEFEKFTENRVHNGTDPPQRLDLARFQRLQAEAELVTLKAEVEKTAPRPAPAGQVTPPIQSFAPVCVPARRLPRLFSRR